MKFQRLATLLITGAAMTACADGVRPTAPELGSQRPTYSMLPPATIVVVPANVTTGSLPVLGKSWYTADTRTEASVVLAAGTVPPTLGAGSALFASNCVVAGCGQAKAQLVTYEFNDTKLSDFTTISYQALRRSSSTNPTAQTISLNLQVDFAGSGASFTTLVYEPVYQPGGVGAMQLDAWQTWDAFASGQGIWWSTQAIPGVCAFSCYVPWSTILANNPNAKIRGSVGFNIGSGWSGTFSGAVDALSIGVTGNLTTFDFEPTPLCTTTCYVNAATGNDANGGTSAADAKQTIAAAIAQLTPTGEVIVAAGTYPANVTITKALTLSGPNIGVHPQYGARDPEAIVQGTLTIGNAINDVTIRGLRIETAGGNVGIGSPGGTVHRNISIVHNDISAGYQPIANGLGFGGGVGSENWTISNNRIGGITSNAATAIVMFNTTGVTITNNYIRHANAAATGRRGINLDGVRNVTVSGNDLDLGIPAAAFVDAIAAGAIAPWAIQLSMSDRSTEQVQIQNNQIGGAVTGIVGLSQRNLTDIAISGNTIGNVFSGVVINGGSAIPAAGTVMSNITVTGNTIAAYLYGTRVRNLHAPTSAVLPNNLAVSFANINVNRNALLPLAGRANNVVSGIFVDDPANIIINGSTTGPINGSCNYWNAANGPGAVAFGSGLLVSSRVVYTEFLTTSNLAATCGADATGPVVSNVSIMPNPAPVTTTSYALTANASDNSAVTMASYSIDGAAEVPFTFTPGASVSLSATLGPLAVGVYDVCVTAKDLDGNISNIECTILAVYDPTAGFVTGGGWFTSPPGAYLADPLLTGKATFGFVSKYVKGKSEPTGNTEFQFKAGNLNFSSTTYQWLVVNQGGKNAQFKGTGSVNGVGGYDFMVWAKDGAPDTFRIKITASNGTVVYDNHQGGEFGSALGGGNIMIKN